MDRSKLAERIKEVSYLEGDFVLRSGKRSKYYLDKYLFETQPDILEALGELFVPHAADAEVIAGPELGAVSLAASASMKTGKPFAIVRKGEKGYGTSKLIEGSAVTGRKVLLVEDIGTTAGAALQAAETLKNAGAEVLRLVFVIDRLQGARENVEAAGFEFHALFTKEDLGI